VIQRLSAGLGGGNGDMEVVFDFILADEIAEMAGTQACIQSYIVTFRFGGNNAFYSDTPFWYNTYFNYNITLRRSEKVRGGRAASPDFF
jgi:hypothetical protein